MSIVHVVGTGTIGEPLIGLLAHHRGGFGIEEVTFHKRTPLIAERAKVADLELRGAVLAVDESRWSDFEGMGHSPKYTAVEAINRAAVVIDCTPVGNQMKEEFYKPSDGPLGFIAQGSEHGFGKMYARGINDHALVRGKDRFVHVVSCNTHNIAVLIRSIAYDTAGASNLEAGRFVCMRRANDISQDEGFVASPTVDRHSDARFGTHHARDAHDLFETLGDDLSLFSSAIRLNTQYMHSLQFSLQLRKPTSVEEVIARLTANPRVAITRKSSPNQIFSFGRDHGFYGRILSQTVIPIETIAVRDSREVVGFAFTPQDGNPLLSTVAATLWFLDPSTVDSRMDLLMPYLFGEI